jgi:hypothetical protein
MTFTLKTSRSLPTGRQTTAQVVTRTFDRVRIAVEGGRQEWLFVQNAAYPDRASGYLIDHRARQVRLHDEQALRAAIGVRGWADVLTMRFDRTILSTLRATGLRRSVGELTFAQFVATGSKDQGIVEVWWSEELLLPLSLTRRESGIEVRSDIEDLTTHADESLLLEPVFRFPDYESRDAADAQDH